MLLARYGFPKAYDWIGMKVVYGFSLAIDFFDRKVIDGVVNVISRFAVSGSASAEEGPDRHRADLRHSHHRRVCRPSLILMYLLGGLR